MICMPHQARYRDIRPRPLDFVDVPCGKCINCLKNKQNAMVARCNAEALHRGSFVFVTLTYDEEHIPIAQSLWRVSKETGEYERVYEGEVVCSARSKRTQDKFVDRASEFRALFKGFKPSESPRYIETDIDGFEDDEYVYKSRLTPSLCRKDVRLWLKNVRVKYEREHGFKLAPFSYVLVGEYGPNTCRPHYHLAFFGLNRIEADWLCSQWHYGYYLAKYVNRVNKDGTDGFAIASKYIGKYMSKGKFDCESVLDCSAEKPRVCQSMGIGSSLLDKIRSQMCAFDVFGEYDLDTLWCPSLGRSLNENEITQLCNEIPHRLSYCVSGNKYRLPIPRPIRQKVFFHQKDTKLPKRVFKLKSDGTIVPRVEERVQRSFIPTTIWSLVADSIREHFSTYSSAKFRASIDNIREGTLLDVVRQYEDHEMGCTQVAEFSSEKAYINFLQSSVF